MMTIDKFRACLNLKPCSAAIDKLLGAFPSELERRNESQELLLYINAWTVAIGSRGIGLVIDDGISENYAVILESLLKVGAQKSFEYAKRAAEICGGAVPSDELERGMLMLRFEEEFYQLDKTFKKFVPEEAAEALVKLFSEDTETAFRDLAQGQKSNLTGDEQVARHRAEDSEFEQMLINELNAAISTRTSSAMGSSIRCYLEPKVPGVSMPAIVGENLYNAFLGPLCDFDFAKLEDSPQVGILADSLDVFLPLDRFIDKNATIIGNFKTLHSPVDGIDAIKATIGNLRTEQGHLAVRDHAIREAAITDLEIYSKLLETALEHGAGFTFYFERR